MNDMSQPEFNSFASHVASNLLTPLTCAQACAAVKYTLAGIAFGTMCFCKTSTQINSVQVNDSICTQLQCAGDSSISCGSLTTWIVYQIQNPAVQVE